MLGHRYQLHPIECNCINATHNVLAQLGNMQIYSIPKLHQPGKNIEVYLCHQFSFVTFFSSDFLSLKSKAATPNATFLPWKVTGLITGLLNNPLNKGVVALGGLAL